MLRGLGPGRPRLGGALGLRVYGLGFKGLGFIRLIRFSYMGLSENKGVPYIEVLI